jgi:hypothetical protein
MKEQVSKAAAASAAAASAAAEAAAVKVRGIEQQLQETKVAATSSQTALGESEKQLKQAVSKGDALQKQLQDVEAVAAAAQAAAQIAAERAHLQHEALEAKLKSSDSELKATTEQMSAAAAAAALTIGELQASCESFKQSTAALQQHLNTTRESLSAAEAAAAAASSRCDSLQNELFSTQTSLADARTRVEDEEARVLELEGKAAEVDGLRSELEESRSQISVVQKKNAESIRQLQREVARQKSHSDSGGGVPIAGVMTSMAELSPVHPASIKITELEAQVAMLKEELERKKRMLSEIAEGGVGSGVILRGAQAVSSGSPTPAHKEDIGDKGVGSKLMSGFKKGGMAALTLGGLIPHKSSPKPDVAAHAIDQEKMNAMEAMLEETVMTNNKLQRELIKVQCRRAHTHMPTPLAHKHACRNTLYRWKTKCSNCARSSRRLQRSSITRQRAAVAHRAPLLIFCLWKVEGGCRWVLTAGRLRR